MTENSTPHEPVSTRNRGPREGTGADSPEYRRLREDARYAAEQIKAQEARNRERLDDLRQARDRAMARLIGWGASYSAAGAAAGLSKSAAKAAAEKYPSEVETGESESGEHQ